MDVKKKNKFGNLGIGLIVTALLLLLFPPLRTVVFHILPIGLKPDDIAVIFITAGGFCWYIWFHTSLGEKLQERIYRK